MRKFFFVLTLSFFLSISANAETTQNTSYHKGLLNSSVLFGGNTSILFDSDDKTGFQSYDLSFQIHENLNLGIGGGYEIKRSDDESSRFYGFGADALFHFSPETKVDPYISVDLAYLKNPISGLEEGGFGVGFDVGVEVKSGRLLSVIPSISYSYANVSIYSYGNISSDLAVAFRFSDEKESFLSKLWFAPSVGITFSAHESEGLSSGEVFNVGLGILVSDGQ
ncbi:outer membrane beta-barrel protein [Candidatus Mycalebacterium sp.]